MHNVTDAGAFTAALRGIEQCYLCGKFGHHSGLCSTCHAAQSTRPIAGVVYNSRQQYKVSLQTPKAMGSVERRHTDGSYRPVVSPHVAPPAPQHRNGVGANMAARRYEKGETPVNGASAVGSERGACGPFLQCGTSQQSWNSLSGASYTLSCYGCRPRASSRDIPPSRDGLVSPSHAFPSDPSITSEDVSLGDPSTCSATTGCRRRENGAKQHSETSPLGSLPGPVACRKSASLDPNARLSQKVVENELLGADVEELVGMLLEIGNSNPDAALFIEDKVRLMVTRRRNNGNMSTATGSSSSSVMAAEPPYEGSWAHRRDGWAFVSRVRTPVPTSVHANDSSVVSSRHLPHEQSFGPISTVSEDRRASRGNTHEESVEVDVELPPFSAELHPCLRWYGGCRYSTRCAFAACPRNLCLDWVRGSCEAESVCGGVHRLPSHCSAEVRTIFELNHGADREELGQKKLCNDGQKPCRHYREGDLSWLCAQNAIHGTEGELDTVSKRTAEGGSATESTLTPRGQIVVDPTSVPASLERLVREMPCDDSGQCLDDGVSLLRGCRGYQSWLCDNDGGAVSRLTPVGTTPVTRSLNGEFVEAADPSLEFFAADVGFVWSSPLNRSGSRSPMAFSGDCEPDIPSFNSRTRSASPIDA